jgi:hypothetical protein
MEQTRYHLRIVRFMSALLFVACSSNSGKHPTPPTGSNTPVPDGGTVAVAPGPSERECTELFAHVIKLQIADSKSPPTPDETAKLEAELRDQYLGECRASTLDRYRCAMAATTMTAYAACQPTPSSSTSNSSVELGGMAPGNPRSP